VEKRTWGDGVERKIGGMIINSYVITRERCKKRNKRYKNKQETPRGRINGREKKVGLQERKHVSQNTSPKMRKPKH